MNKKYLERKERLLPDGRPRYIRCYDNMGESADRYTVVFTGNYTHLTVRSHWYLAMNAAPFHPQGFGQHGFSGTPIDRPAYAHLGKKISFDNLPEDCKTFVLQEYVYMWDITDHPLYREN
jgi:hypothetical protein